MLEKTFFEENWTQSSDPEIAQDLRLAMLNDRSHALEWKRRHLYFPHDRLTREILDVKYSSPIGIAAGFNKTGIFMDPRLLGASCVEVGTVPPEPQDGHKKPRQFIDYENHALINHMGFNSFGALVALDTMRSEIDRWKMQRWINLGKNRDTSAADIARDYRRGIEILSPYGDVVVLNASSPNTYGLRGMFLENIDEILLTARKALDNMRKLSHTRARLAIKISPDHTLAEIDIIVAACKKKEHDVEFIIMGNSSNDQTFKEIYSFEKGGLSGDPLFEKSLRKLEYIRKQWGGILVGVGGINTPERAWKMLLAGADLLQVYAGLVFGGPHFIHKLNEGLLAIMDQHGVDHISDIKRLNV